MIIYLLTAVLVFLAVQRVINRDYNIDGDVMLITAGCGVAFNIIMIGVLHTDCASDMGGLIKHGHSHGGKGDSGHSHGGRESSDGGDGGDGTDSESGHSHSSASSSSSKKTNINVRAAMAHVIGDLIQSVGVLIAAYVIKYRVRKLRGEVSECHT